MRSLIIILICSLVACKNNSIPKDVLPEERMRSIMWDMLRADEYVMNTLARDSSRTVKQHLNEQYNKVFAIHKIQGTQFYKSYQYYQQDPILHKRLMDSVYAYGNRERQEAQKRMTPSIVQ